MSICLLAAAATTQVTTSNAELIAGIVFAVVALLVAYLLGAFRPNNVVGPMRLDETDSPARVLAITLLGFGLWFGVSGTYLALVHGRDVAEARQRNLEFNLPLRESAILNAAAQFIALIAVWLADRMALRDGGRKIGSRLAQMPGGIIAGAIGACVAIPLTFAASIFVTRLWLWLDLAPPESHQLIRLMKEQPDRLVKWIVIVSAVVIAPLFEETIFRGHIQTLIAHTIRRYRGLARPFDPIALADAPWIRWIGICGGALVFSLIHEASWMMPPLFVLAVCFGYVYERTGKLWAPILMHALFNATSILLALFTNG